MKSNRSTCVCRYRAPNKDAWPRARSAECGAPGEPTVPAGSRMNRTESLAHRLFQHHRHGALRHLVFEGWNAEHPLRAIRFRDVCSADWRRAITAGLDAIQEVQQIGLQVHLIICRRNAVDAGSTVLAGQPIGLHHPVQIDDVVERVQRRPPFRPRQTGYPLSVRRQVCGSRVPSVCQVNGSLLMTPSFPPSGPGEPGSPASAVL